jgi:hypothetical protein
MRHGIVSAMESFHCSADVITSLVGFATPFVRHASIVIEFYETRPPSEYLKLERYDVA